MKTLARAALVGFVRVVSFIRIFIVSVFSFLGLSIWLSHGYKSGSVILSPMKLNLRDFLFLFFFKTKKWKQSFPYIKYKRKERKQTRKSISEKFSLILLHLLRHFEYFNVRYMLSIRRQIGSISTIWNNRTATQTMNIFYTQTQMPCCVTVNLWVKYKCRASRNVLHVMTYKRKN